MDAEQNLPRATIEQFKNSQGEDVSLKELLHGREQRKELRNYLQQQNKLQTEADAIEAKLASKRRTIKIESANEEERVLRRQKFIAMALKNKYSTNFIPPEMVENIVKVDINKEKNICTIWLKDGSTIIDDGTTISLNSIPNLDNSKELIEMAHRNNWKHISLTGSEDFKYFATIAAMRHEPPIKTDFDIMVNKAMLEKHVEPRIKEILNDFQHEKKFRDLLSSNSESANQFKLETVAFGIEDAIFKYNHRETKRQAILIEQANKRVSDYIGKYTDKLEALKTNLTNVRVEGRREAADEIAKTEHKLRLLRDSGELQKLIRERKIAEFESLLEQKYCQEQQANNEKNQQQYNQGRSYKNG